MGPGRQALGRESGLMGEQSALAGLNVIDLSQRFSHYCGKLFADMDGRGKVSLIALSETLFSGLYGLGVEFVTGASGGLFVKHVSGDYRFARR